MSPFEERAARQDMDRHRSVRTARWLSVGVVSAALACGGCSVAWSRVTPKDPAERKQGEKCGGIKYPLYDLGWTLLGAANVVLGRSLQKPERIPTGSGEFVEVRTGKEDYGKVQETTGYAQMAVFGASAVYGFVVEGICAPRRPQSKAERAKAAPARMQFPGAVDGFAFDVAPAAAERVCTPRGQRWKLAGPAGTTGYCRSEGRVPRPDVRIQFTFGVASQIALLYPAAPERLAGHYDQLYAALRASLGAPQVDREPLTDDCANSLGACLARGARPRGAAWHWPEGSVELAPVLDERNAAVIELEYTRHGRAEQ